MLASLLVLAQDAPAVPGGAVGGVISVSVVGGLVIFCWVMTKVSGWRWVQIAAGVCLGVAGANGFVGDIGRMLTGIGVRAFQAVMSGFGM